MIIVEEKIIKIMNPLINHIIIVVVSYKELFFLSAACNCLMRHKKINVGYIKREYLDIREERFRHYLSAFSKSHKMKKEA